ncbi:TIGR00255 family protein [Lutimaribacter pacificus]|uniref:TIGR00255 family protein n=1 Tax=Lutimaribacter pacificus TaxID=391948 RepID=A0A1H0AKV5_9RHOB|nr:YicC/YloC family endoribonuclease [Lutimaribacter pacificus]SDN33446.1 TIGR00255 family protein [Lutimaribacter pacificus]SHJ68625.1 TIGR00255 family protein [Lutimaribacter pacificus]
MTRSMTAFAAAKGGTAQHSWAWELRSVNAKGLDIRMRLPDWIEGLEAALRARLGQAVTRGSVTLNLRVSREEGEARQAVNDTALAAVLTALSRVEARAAEAGLALAPTRAADILALRGVLETTAPEDEAAGLKAALMQDFEPVLAAFLEMRAGEGAALATILGAQLDEIARLTEAATEAAEARRDDMAGALKTSLARVMDNAEDADPQRVAQELALIAVKSDITEELDRLRAHVDAARELLGTEGPVGRKLDFLMQEFNREANTLCSKSQNTGLTRIGLDLKTVIDQMREQVQNVE